MCLLHRTRPVELLRLFVSQNYLFLFLAFTLLPLPDTISDAPSKYDITWSSLGRTIMSHLEFYSIVQFPWAHHFFWSINYRNLHHTSNIKNISFAAHYLWTFTRYRCEHRNNSKITTKLLPQSTWAWRATRGLATRRIPSDFVMADTLKQGAAFS